MIITDAFITLNDPLISAQEGRMRIQAAGLTLSAANAAWVDDDRLHCLRDYRTRLNRFAEQIDALPTGGDRAALESEHAALRDRCQGMLDTAQSPQEQRNLLAPQG